MCIVPRLASKWVILKLKKLKPKDYGTIRQLISMCAVHTFGFYLFFFPVRGITDLCLRHPQLWLLQETLEGRGPKLHIAKTSSWCIFQLHSNSWLQSVFPEGKPRRQSQYDSIKDDFKRRRKELTENCWRNCGDLALSWHGISKLLGSVSIMTH